MSSIRSHFRHNPQQHQNSEQTFKSTSRIPTKSASAENGKQGKPVQHVSKLSKKSSRSLKTAEPSGKSSTTRTATPLTGVAQPSTGKNIPVAPSGTTLSAPPNMRTPSLVSGSSASTFDSPRSALRRKPSGAIDRYAAQRRNEPSAGVYADDTAMFKRNEPDHDAYEDTVLGLSLPPTSNYGDQVPYLATSGDELTERNVTRNFTPPTLGMYAPSATPSTRYTDSPFSHAPTPSSVSSYSSSMMATTSNVQLPFHGESPARSKSALASQSSSKGEAPRSGLPIVRESSTSSSNSTVRAESKLLQSRVPRTSNGTLPAMTLDKKTSRNQKTPSPTLERRPTPQVPPELAHLDVQMEPHVAAQQKSPPPVRPSREGISTFSDMSNPSAVVQSDLPRLYTTYHKRTPSQETPASSGSPSLKSRFGFSRSSSRNEHPRVDSALSPEASTRNLTSDSAPEAPRREAAKLRRKDSPAVVTASPEKSSRFGLFSRKSKSEPPKVLEKPRRQPSKGPAAGTGHEGYGRFGSRGRSGSAASSSAMSSGVRSPSNSSSSSLPRPRTTRKSSSEKKDGSDLDDFLRERLNPVILRGSGSTVSNAASSSYFPEESIHPDSSKAPSLESLSRPRLLPSAMSGSSAGSPVKRPGFSRQTTADSSDDEYAARYPSIATRRSMTRMSSADSKSPIRLPPPINTDLPPRQASVDSYDAETSAWPQTDSTLPPHNVGSFEGEGQWLRSPPPPEHAHQSGRRWNFFQRATASPSSKGKEKVQEQRRVPELVAHQSPYNGVAHYAMLGPVAPIALEETERIALENETSADESMSGSFRRSRLVPYERRHTSLLPAPHSPDRGDDRSLPAIYQPPRIKVDRQDSAETPELLHARPATAHHAAQVVDIAPSMSDAQAALTCSVWTDSRHLVSTPEPMQGSFGTAEQPNGSPRQPRLSPIGRIPAVISRRDRDRRLPDNSFSRPFARTQPRPSVKPPGSIYNQIRDMASPIEASSQPVSSTSTRSDVTGPKSSAHTYPPSISTNRTSMEIHVPEGFLAFPPRKLSEQSYSSSSHGNPSWTSAMFTQPLQQEDVWNEYNDFLDEVMPLKTPLKTPDTSSSFGAPFQYSSMLYEGNNQPQWPRYSSIGVPPTSKLPSPPGRDLTSTVLSVPQQISRFLQPSMSPLSPDTLSGFVGGYGNRSTSTLFTQGRNSGPGQARTSFQQPGRASLVSVRDSVASSRYSHSRSTSLPEENARHSHSSVAGVSGQVRDAQLSGIADIPHDKKGVTTNLRLGALMTSKWLSFGRVLFSPAHNEMQLTQDPKVLVVDGLSSDWSYYVALSYPAAQVYNLTPSMPGSPSFTWPDESEKPPPNHRQIPLGSIATPFPFPKGFFTAVVFRFPSATTEEAYTACIAECKRVLRPGGYLEVAVLDLDLMNMGTKARRAVRGLKTRMQQCDSAVCLRNLSDVLVSLIGRRGFDSVQRCIVGVPAAGHIPRSQDKGSVSSGSSGRAVVWRRERTTKSQEFSFADLLKDARTDQFGPGRNNDESITKMVAKVGRWWYTTCYEKALLPTDQSIWSDPTLLRECEKQGTSFRLLICHAQKPTQTRRRTVSV